ncbi:MAG: HD domain-containing protein [Capsulimonadaceae bacterium]
MLVTPGLGVNTVDYPVTEWIADERLARQIRFILEIDRLKSVFRRTYLLSEERFENSAEHSWHIAVMVMVLAEHSNVPFDTGRVLRMLLLHDTVEVDAGDTYCYDEAGALTQSEREHAAADRLFSILPDDQRDEFRGLWEEFEARRTPEAQFAAAVDRLMPLLHNYCTGGRAWQEHGIRIGQVVDRNHHIEDGSADLWTLAKGILADAVDRGFLAAGSGS